MNPRVARWFLRRLFPEGVHIVFVADGVVSAITAAGPTITVRDGPSTFGATMGAGLIGPGIPYAPPWIAAVRTDPEMRPLDCCGSTGGHLSSCETVRP